jgi:hypothetical protein
MRPKAAGDWFAIPLRSGLFAVGCTAAADERDAILGYFFARFFERLPSRSDILAIVPGDADIIGVCSLQGLRHDVWPVIANDPRPWTIPIFREIEPATGMIRWKTFEPPNLLTAIAFEHEPKDAGSRNWGLPMAALESAPMSWVMVESTLWRCFRVFQNGRHRKYIADLNSELAATAPQRSRYC